MLLFIQGDTLDIGYMNILSYTSTPKKLHQLVHELCRLLAYQNEYFAAITTSPDSTINI